MNTQFSGKPKTEVILVAKADVAIANAANATENLFDPSSLVANILDGQLGVVCDTHTSSTRAYNEFIDSSDDAVKVDTIRIVQGTPASADISAIAPLPYGDKAAVKSYKIQAKNGIMYTAKVAKSSSSDAWVIGGSLGAITPVSETDYKLHLQFISARNDKYFSVQGNENLSINFTTPDYTTLATTSPLDHLVQNLVYNADLNSYAMRYNMPFVRRGNKNFVAFALKLAGGSGTKIGNIVAGVSFPAITSNGSTVSYIPNGDFVETIKNVIANGSASGVSANTTIELVDLSTAGAATKTDAILLVALDHTLAAARDEIVPVKVRLNVGLEYGFQSGVSAAKANLSKPFEGEGKARTWQLYFDNGARLNIFTQQSRMHTEYFLQAPSYIDATKDYTAYIIDSKEEYQVAYSHDSEYFHRTIILVPVTEQPEVKTLTVTTKSTGATNATVVLNGVSFTVPLTDDTAGTASTTATTIRAFSFTGWTTSGSGANVIFTRNSSGPVNGAFTFSHGTAVATYATTTAAAKVTDATIKSGLNTYLGQWLTSVRALGKLESSTPPATSFFI
jgi:hypothetical protein